MESPSQEIKVSQIKAISIIAAPKALTTLGVGPKGLTGQEDIILYLFTLKNPKFIDHLEDMKKVFLTHIDREPESDASFAEAARLQQLYPPSGIHIQSFMLRSNVEITIITAISPVRKEFISASPYELLPI